MRPTKYPVTGEITMVSPTKITDLGVYVSLLEYNNIEGLIILSDLSKSRFRSINKIVSVGKKFPAIVQSIEENKNIALSKKAVTSEEISTCEKNFRTTKYIYDIVNFFTKKIQKEKNITIDIDTAYHTFIWTLGTDTNEIYLLLKSAAKDFNKCYENKLENIDPLWKECFQAVLELKFKEKEVLLEAVLDISCYEEGGVDTIRSALLKGQELVTKEFPFKIKLIKAPFYSITIRTLQQEKAIELISNVINVIKNELEKNHAILKVHKMPDIVIDEEFKPENSDEEDEEDEIGTSTPSYN